MLLTKNEVFTSKAELFIIKKVGKTSWSDSRYDHTCIAYMAEILSFPHNNMNILKK